MDQYQIKIKELRLQETQLVEKLRIIDSDLGMPFGRNQVEWDTLYAQLQEVRDEKAQLIRAQQVWNG